MSENNNIRPYLLPAFQETPSSQRAELNQESPSTSPRRGARKLPRVRKEAPKSRVRRNKDVKNPSPSPDPSPATPTEYSVATHYTAIPGHGSIFYAEDCPPLFVPSTIMHVHQAPVAQACPCHQLQAASIAQMHGMHMPSIGVPTHGHVGGLGWNENAWGYVPGHDLGDLSQMHGNLNFNHSG
ncbi:uncharacterized protein FPRO_13982 [Fusarium proliferatum ET1]|uniref:Uncharacterized protein n=1 Tax=Fusarium proliferatum (strain ET1) TaxID=1227346 RepID=A0A1L7VUV0_FUSPR|nr:uncharacterized protein FPRO_13982 [Fusarium proliferatum ET1]CZR44203.1 uncharacterized protein FPRO_13982 [Fusarium proliferatum ET1]